MSVLIVLSRGDTRKTKIPPWLFIYLRSIKTNVQAFIKKKKKAYPKGGCYLVNIRNLAISLQWIDVGGAWIWKHKGKLVKPYGLGFYQWSKLIK